MSRKNNETVGDEWYTPEWAINEVRAVMGDIDFDPASCEAAQKVVKAGAYCDKRNDGLLLEWHGRIFVNRAYVAGHSYKVAPRHNAVLQSFPQSFVWPEAIGDAGRLIGNAVPTLLAWRIAQTIEG